MLKKSVFRKSIILPIIVLFAITILVGRSDIYRDITNNWKLLYEVYKQVMTNYSDQIDPESFAEAGIRGMLNELDPYTIYMERDEREGLNMLTKGRYSGVGIQLGIRDDSLTVIAPMEETPAQRAGILPGDKIVKIDGELTKDMNINDAAKKIRGEKASVVVLTIVRYGEVDPIDFELTRSFIKVKDVPYAGMIDDETGYIRLTRFSRNSSVEVRKSLLSLQEQGMTKLILDLRGNPGGLLDAAIKISDMITEKGSELLSTRGRSPESNRTYLSQTDPIIDSSTRVVVLIDGGSASASEIVSGAIQDLDRGIIVGVQSFGKGLVQSVFQLDQDRSVKITTAKYYIPSGRLIQKPGYIDKELLLSIDAEDSIFSTKNGREVLAKGGITPDVEVKLDKTPPLTRECWRRGLFFKFSSMYVQNHTVTLPVSINETILSDFREFINTKDITLKVSGEKQFHEMEKELDSLLINEPNMQHSLNVLTNYFQEAGKSKFDEEKESLMIGLEREISSILGNQSARIVSSFDDDKQILKALEILRDQYSYDSTLNPSEF